MRGITILGATGSIGVSTLDVLSRHREQYRVVALTAYADDRKLLAQCEEHQPDYAVLVQEEAGQRFQAALAGTGLETRLLVGAEGLETVAALPEVETVMAAIVGSAGLLPTLAAARAGKRVLLANKESLVMAGALLTEAVAEGGAELIPIDSEHNAIFQCLPAGYERPPEGVRRIVLTASGGPFLHTPLRVLATVSPEAACAHPNWEMGRKISVDSATLMNKGLEVIEATWLFGLPPQRVEVVVHPQSVVHSLVEYVDGSVLAQLGNPDMRTPIAHALGWPRRLDSGVAPLDLIATARLDFLPPDETRFPCLRLAREAAAAGGAAPAVLNAANEIAVAAFLDRRIGFRDIAAVIEEVLADGPGAEPAGLAELLALDRAARELAQAALGQRERVRA
jgi:1-deoxy-D-xylulose-5-phosphate reductoisomerase